MKLLLSPLRKSDTSTISKLLIDGYFFCYTLEDKDRGLDSSMNLLTIKAKKLFGITAIPAGTYDIVLSLSNRFKRIAPEILNVKGFSGVRIHRGNYAGDTEGCLIVGLHEGIDCVLQSGDAEKALMLKLQDAVNRKEPITLTIKR